MEALIFITLMGLLPLVLSLGLLASVFLLNLLMEALQRWRNQ